MNKAELLRELRALTQAGMKDCLDALNEAGDDLQKAVDIIKTKGKNIVSSRLGKTASEGQVIAKLDDELGCLVECNSQTDFVAKSYDFGCFASLVVNNFFESVKSNSPFDPATDKDISARKEELISSTKENIVVRRWWAEQTVSPLARVFSYVHSNNQIGVLLTLLAPSLGARNEPAFIELGNDLAMQIAAMSPLGISPDTLPPDEVERQKNIFLTQIAELNKPAPAQAKILDGKLNKWYSEVCLLEQDSVVVSKTPVKKVLADLGTKFGGEIKVVTMIRCQVGEGIQQQVSNLAEEVAKMME